MVDYLKDAPDEIAKMLFKLGAVKVNLSNYYRLGSGDFSPLYVDARQLLSDMDARSRVSSRILLLPCRKVALADRCQLAYNAESALFDTSYLKTF